MTRDAKTRALLERGVAENEICCRLLCGRQVVEAVKRSLDNNSEIPERGDLVRLARPPAPSGDAGDGVLGSDSRRDVGVQPVAPRPKAPPARPATDQPAAPPSLPDPASHWSDPDAIAREIAPPLAAAKIDRPPPAAPEIVPPLHGGPAAGPSTPSLADVRTGDAGQTASRATPHHPSKIGTSEADELRAVAARHGVPVSAITGILFAARMAR